MSWPSDGGPRFVISSVTGYGERAEGHLATAWGVIDRAYCHHLVWEFSNGLGDAKAKAKAQWLADLLNGVEYDVVYALRWMKRRRNDVAARAKKKTAARVGA